MTSKSARGKLIVLEGPDGVGKTTLAQGLVGRISEAGISCEYLAFPGKQPGSLGCLVYDLHHDAKAFGLDPINPTSLQVLHIAAHIEAIEERILPALKAGRWVVLDRFGWSTWVYGTALGVHQRSLEAMLRLEDIHWRGNEPDVVFLVERATGSTGRSNEAEYASLASLYKALVDRERARMRIKTIQNASSITDALDEMWAELEALLPCPGQVRAREEHPSQSGQLPLLLGERPQALRTSRLSPAKPTIVYDTYWHFAAERQEMFFRRLEGRPQPWTDDPILRRYKFTNAYRASDRVSQYLIRHVIYEGDQSAEEVFFRIILFKVFNKIDTWERLKTTLGEVSYSSYSFEKYDSVLTNALAEGHTIYSGAYIMPSASSAFGYPKKHRNHLKLIERMMVDEVPLRLTEARTMHKAFDILRSYPSLGDFLAYQFVTDINYSELTNFSEKEFVIPGPGALDGIHKCFSDLGGLNEADIIRLVTDRQQEEFEQHGIEFRSLWGRQLQLIDCQNLFCEVGKYARLKHPEFKGVGNRVRIKQFYHPSADRIAYWYPPKWGINHLISSSGASYVSPI